MLIDLICVRFSYCEMIIARFLIAVLSLCIGLNSNAQKKIEKNVQEATFELEDLSLINVVASTKSEKEDIILKQDYYSIIAGSFRSVENANKRLEQLKSEGYPAELAEVNPEGIHRVAYGRYLTKKEAINMLYFIKYTLKEEAWYLEEK